MFDALLAGRADDTLDAAEEALLQQHLGRCETCRRVADTLTPEADAGGDHSELPTVDPSTYALGLELARGGMGRILAARDLRIGRPVVVKELLGGSSALAARFEREARMTARLQHPAIVPIYEIGRWPDGTPFYSMRMIEGRTLREAIDAAKTLAERLALVPSVIAASEAVAFAHGQRIVHRDLTPANIIVGAHGETVVIDWGLAKDLASTVPDPGDADRGDASNVALTGAGAVLGTLPYMPPEQACGFPVDERADVYALGAILYHVLAGAPPFEAPSRRDLMRRVKKEPPTPLAQRAAGVPRDLLSIVEKAMRREAGARYPSARVLSAELQRFQTGRLVLAHEYSRRERVLRFVRRHRAAVVTTLAAIAVLAVVATVAVVRVLQSRSEARLTAQELLLERGRVELLGGNTHGALAYLHAAAGHGPSSPALVFLAGSALRSVPESTLLDCGGYAYAVDVSPDGETLAAACTGSGMIWRLRDHTPLAALGPFDSCFHGVRYAPDGASLVTWGTCGTARLWSTRTGTLLATFAHGAEISIASFSPDGDRVVTAGNDGYARIWNAQTGAELVAIPAAADRLLRVVYGRMSPDGRVVYTVTIHGDARAWDATTGTPLGGYDHGSFTLGGDLSTDGKLAVSCGVDRIVRVWDATNGALVRTLAGHTDVVWKCVFDPQVTHLLTTGHDGRANVWNLATGALVVAVEHGDILTSASFSPDGGRFVTIGVDGRAKVWDSRSGALIASLDAWRGTNARFTADSRGLMVQRGDGRLELWHDIANHVAFTPADPLVDVSADGARAVVETAQGALAIWDTSRTRAIANMPVRRPLARADGAAVLAGITDDGVALVDLDTGEVIGAIPRTPRAMTLSARGDHVALALPDAIEIWSTKPAVRVERVVAAESGVRLVALSADGTRLVVLEHPSSPDQSATIVDVGSGDVIQRERVATARLDPSGTLLTTIGADRAVRVLRLSDARELAAFHGEQLVDAQANASATLIAAVGEYGRAAFVLDAANGRQLARWPLDVDAPMVTQTGFAPPAVSVWWSPTGAAVIARSRSAAVWPAESASMRALANVMRRVPWRVEAGRLVMQRDRTLRARVVDGSTAIAGAQFAVEIRRGPELSAGTASWDSMRTRYSTRSERTDGEGRIRVDGLAPGVYRVVVTTPGGETRAFEAFVDANIAEAPEQVFDLAASR